MNHPNKSKAHNEHFKFSPIGMAVASTSLALFCGGARGFEVSFQLEEVVVTAKKRAESLNDVGLTVQALSGEALSERNIFSLEDIANSIPGLSYSNNLTGAPVYTLRGVGFYDTSLAAYPTTSVYLDEVPLPFPMLTRHHAYDMERLEVLKGPQGTLFGQNSTGGAINYIAKKPSQSFEAGIKASYGRFDAVILESFVNGSLTDTLSARFAARSETADGWQSSLTRPGDTNGAVDNRMARLILDYHPTDSARFQLTLNGWTDKSDSQAPQLIGKNPQTAGAEDADITAAPFAPENPADADWTPGMTEADNRFSQAALRADIDFEHFTLTSLTSYLDYDQDQRDESDGTAASNIDQVINRGSVTSFSQELRLSDPGVGDLRWVVGLNYSRDDPDQIMSRLFVDSSANNALAPLGYPVTMNFFTADQEVENQAVFGNIEYSVTDRITLKAGARYTESEREADICNTDPTGTDNDLGAFTYDVILGGAQGPYTPGDCMAANLTLPGQTPRTLGGVPVGTAGRFIDTLKEDNVSWTGGIDFIPSEDLLLYLNLSKGYKAGSYPMAAASNVFQYLPVTQESVMAYESGFKLTAWDRRLQFNGAAFYYDYKDKQLRSKFVDPVFGILDILQNVPKSTIKGVEFDLTARPLPGLTVTGAITYLDSEINEFVGFDVAGNFVDFAGSEISYTPKYQAVFDIGYNREMAAGLNGFVGLTANYRSEAESKLNGEDNPPGARGPVSTFFEIDSYTLVDARLGLENSDGTWRLYLFGKNIFDEYYFNNAEAGFDTIGRYAGKPAIYGVSFEYNFMP